MEYQEALKELEQVRSLQKYISFLNERIELLSTVIEHSSSDIIKMGQGGGEGVEAKLAKLADLKIKREQQRAVLYRREIIITESISSLPDLRHSLILERYYINGERLEKICVDMNYDYRWVKRLKKRAIEAYRVMRSCY